jgi:hypothetical protein
MTRIPDADIPARMTADGIAVKRGDVVWSNRLGGMPRRKAVTRDMLKVWTWWRLHESTFVNENLALLAARVATESDIARAKRVAAKSMRAMAIGTRTLEMIAARLRGKP